MSHLSELMSHLSELVTHWSGLVTHRSGLMTHLSGLVTHRSGLMDHFVSLFVQFGLLHHRIDASRAPGRFRLLDSEQRPRQQIVALDDQRVSLTC